MAADVDIEALGLLDGLEGDVRQERAELIKKLLDHGFSAQHIRASVAAPLDPTGKGRKRWVSRWKAPLNAFELAFPGRLTTSRN